MAESILFDVAAKVIEVLGTEAVKEIASIWCVEEDLDELRQTLLTIKAVLHDAEKRQVNEEGVRIWLERLQDVVSDVENLLDDVSYEALRETTSKKACDPLSLPKRLIFRRKVAHGIKDVKNTLKKIEEDKNQFGFKLSNNEERIVTGRNRETHSYVEEEKVSGREKEKEEIIEQLLSLGAECNMGREDLIVIPIVGIGGLGKTTLAQQIYNDPRVNKHFDLRIWVYVSQDFNVRSIVEKIIKSDPQRGQTLVQGELQQLQTNLREEILNGKKYLLVLDDVWNEDPQKWEDLETLLRNGKRGNKILLTTRSDIVSRITGATKPYRLGSLDEEYAWDLFTRIALRGTKDLDDHHKVSIGREIVKRCYGVPLAIKSIASLLFANPEIDWFSFKEELSGINAKSDQDTDILSTLKLSYDYLPSVMKRCFAYLSLYPKGYEMDKIMLIDHWLAQGFIASTSYSSHEQPVEEAALQCFEGLVSRSFLEYDRGYHDQYKMHDLFHDLAARVGGKSYAIISNDKVKIDKSTHHVSLHLNNLDPILTGQMRSSLAQAKMIQSIIIPTESNFVIFGRRFEPFFYKEILSKFKFLRSLDLHDSGITKIPKSIAKLKHLKSLDLSHNVELKILSDSICKLLNLQSLNLSSCFELEKLPKGVSQLVSLRNLRLDYCHSLTHLPSGLGQLSNLQTLSRLVLSEDPKSAKIADLRNLNNLRGGLEIRNLRHGMDIEAANIREKSYLQSLSLFWLDNQDVVTGAVEHERTLRGTQCMPRLKDFTLNGYGSVHLPSWFPFTNLVKLRLESMSALEYVSCSSCESSSPSMMPSLKQLRLINLPNFKGWWRDMINVIEDESDLLTVSEHDQIILPCFPHLELLHIRHCPQLVCMPLFPFLSYELQLKNTTLKPLLKTITQQVIPPSSSTFYAPLAQVERVIISKNDDLECLPDYLRNLTSMLHLNVVEFSKLKSLSPGIQYFVSLRSLFINCCENVDLCDDNVWKSLRRLEHLSLRELPQLANLPEGLQHVTTLKVLEIGFCNNFANLPEWICNLHLSCIEVMECCKLTSFPKGLSAEITSHDEENVLNFPCLRRRFGIPATEELYNCIPIPMLRLRLQSDKVDEDPSQNSASLTGLVWSPESGGAFFRPSLATNS